MSQPLTTQILQRHLPAASAILLMLDFDGTLVPLPSDHDQHQLPNTIQNLLQVFITQHQFPVAVISGRAMEDLHWRCQLPGLSLGSDHGVRLNIEGRQSHWFADIWQLKRQLDPLRPRLLNTLNQPKLGVIVESKPFSIAMHYKYADTHTVAQATTQFQQIIGEHEKRYPTEAFHTIFGHCIMEYRPHRHHKGVLVEHLIQHYQKQHDNLLPIFMGDDTTDEDAFAALPQKSLGIKIGKPIKSAAPYYLESQDEVEATLNSLQKLMNR